MFLYAFLDGPYRFDSHCSVLTSDCRHKVVRCRFGFRSHLGGGRVLPSLAHYRRKVHSSEKAANPCASGSIAYAADSSESLDAAIS
ncbi:hypothetical protein CEXT_439061 [Caerostris extrusa]|uniref:Uncharacterized protein n=1 Tax=Caerostris extrusa TaxID=172846 RepID=A0AAV4NZ14_CAEEX|nr:hypothetical protein CEXT_439061 [Caerostris extrusa]